MKHRLQLQNRWTDSDDELVAECTQIREGLARFGLVPIGYDPGVTVSDADGRGTADIPLWLLKKLLAFVPPRT